MRDISGVEFRTYAVYYVPEDESRRIRMMADCSNQEEADDVAMALCRHQKRTFISTDGNGKPTVWEPSKP